MKSKKIITNLLMWLLVGIVSSIVSHFLLEFIMRDFHFGNVLNEILNGKGMLFLLGSGVIFLFYTLFSTLFGSAVIGSISVVSVTSLIAIANNLKGSFRGEPIYPNEIYWLKEMPFLFEMVGTRITIVIIIILIVSAVLTVLLYRYVLKPLKDEMITKEKNIARGVGFILSVGLLIYATRFNHLGNLIYKTYSEHTSWISWNQPENYEKNGFIAGFLFNLNAPSMIQPDNYSKDTVNKIFDKYNALASEANNDSDDARLDTNLIFIMNESFSDPFNLEGVESNEDPIPYFRQLTQQSIRGSLFVPGFGGGTATNEFQVLTGVSTEALAPSISSPFIQMTQDMERLPSVANKMKEFGYKTTAIHSFSPTYYRRNDVYDNLGFEDFIHQDTMRYTEAPDVNHPYISDLSTYREMFDVMESTDEVDFLHLVTMQNHSGYRDNYEEHHFNVSGTGDFGSAIGYFQDLKESDEALKMLIEKIDAFDEPVLLVFWGDHLPGFYKEEIISKNSMVTLHETPFFIYSNDFELEEDIGMRSLIYLNNYVNKILNFDLSPFDTLLLKLEEKLPILDARLYYDTIKSEELFSRSELSEEAQELLREYSLILYDVTTGNNYANELGFFR